jgi:nicotinate-nucleotide--dimethylbenzimidazole phosphoribosyltransferase
MELSTEDVWRHLDSLTKPPRSLGRLEELAVRLCTIQGTISPCTKPRRLVLFAADHGVVAAGVSAWPASVTASMVRTICTGKAASTIFAATTETDAVLVNVGVRRDALPACEAFNTRNSSVRYCDVRFCDGARNLAEEPALSSLEFMQALDVGRQEANLALRDGMQVVIAGEMGIGNTTSASCLAMLLANIPLQDAVGRGAGANDATLERKRVAVQSAVSRSRQRWPADKVAAIAGVAGLEIAAMAGFYMAAQINKLTIILDGYVASAAALIAEQLQPGTAASMIAAHLSAEPGHRFLLARLGLTPFLEWNMRLGEGTGALVLLPLLDAAARMSCEMTTLNSLGLPVS